MNSFKAFINRFIGAVRVLVTIAVIGVSFYSGMYIMAAKQNPEDAKGVMVAKLEKVFENTSDQPIVMIVPDRSLYEKVKLQAGFELPERQVITLTTTETKHMLGMKIKQDPNMISTALTFWSSKANSAHDGVKSGWKWWSDKITIIGK